VSGFFCTNRFEAEYITQRISQEEVYELPIFQTDSAVFIEIYLACEIKDVEKFELGFI
jgi:hypothetical protein